jgi:hypothetical protein
MPDGRVYGASGKTGDHRKREGIMYKFNYVMKTGDGKSGPVSSDFVAGRLLSRTMDGIKTADSGRWIELHMADGAKVRFELNEHNAEVQYFQP